MKYGYKTIRKLLVDDLRELCIKKNWYTRGDTDEFHNMLNMAKKDDITSDDIVDIASDIIEHSNINEYKFTNVCNAILSECYTFMVEEA